MKVLFLGTGAADWVFAKDKDDKYFRRMSSVLINGELLIDPGPDLIESIDKFKVDTSKIKFVINTHKHSDHYNEKTLEFLKSNGVRFDEFTPGDVKQIGKYTITALAANHPVPTCHYIINDGEKKLFYGLDGAWLMYDEVQEIIKQKPIDLAVLDATIGFIEGDFRNFEHNNLNMVLEIKKTLSEHINKFCISHMAFTLHTEHEILFAEMNKYDILTAYDGFLLEV